MRASTLLLMTTVMIVGQALPGWAGHGDCGQPKSRGAYPQAVDALYMLKAAVNMKDCDLGVCDVDADCGIGVGDVLLTLRNSVSGEGELSCSSACATTTTCEPGYECQNDASSLLASSRHERDGDSDHGSGRGDRGNDRNGDSDRGRRDRGDRGGDRDGDSGGNNGSGDNDGDSDAYSGDPLGQDPAGQPGCVCVPVDPQPTGSTTTTMTSATTTVTVVAPSSTTTSLRTTTTMGASSSAGQQIYENECGTCHIAGSFDTRGFAPDLTRKVNKLRQNISSLTGSHPSNLQFSSQEIDNLKAFLNSL